MSNRMQRRQAETVLRPAWARFVAAVHVFSLTAIMAACAPGDTEPPAPTAASTSSSSPSAAGDSTSPSPPLEPTQEALEDTMPTGFFSLGTSDAAVFRDGHVLGLELQEVLIEDRSDGQRVILNFNRDGGTSGSGEIELWASAVEEAISEGPSPVIPMDGEFLLQVSIPGASPLLDEPAPDVALPRGGVVEDVAMTGAFTGFEGGGSLYLGLSSTDVEYCLSSSVDPSRVVIDIRFE
ncbi:AMIN-like domain-containing (lipo)protein [Ruania halotolerans]|uniref:AMIN-like domain-containing (lipo)protein n=1 Tax=Ruania halotolerans TaxID=2897773 RepID=UPI001E3F0B40|nr:hypothetical protein [Ruania halotolerans]UFU06596.1 hypothetical protein LQF10_00335 [Ruania halotolerans]